jgi:Cdc6-like AAA superfamily ATPase
MTSIDTAKENFLLYRDRIDEFIREDLNESDTRSKLIDKFIVDVLGWSENDILREGKVDSGYYDYKVTCPAIGFVIEAKRGFTSFQLPSNHRKAKIKSILKDNADLFKQIRAYALDIGLQYGIMTNGKQFVICKLINVDGSDWKENDCLLFNGIDDVNDRFVEFYENLSKSAIISNGGFRFDYVPRNIEAKTIISTIANRDKEIDRNNLSSKLSPLIDDFFGEIFNSQNDDENKDFIKECFVENVETKKNRDEIERLFEDKAPALSSVIKAVNTKNIISQISEEISVDEISVKNVTPPKPIIIIGSKGAGKTTFINHLFKLKEEELSVNHLNIYIDFRAFFDFYGSFDPHNISREIIEKIYEKYSSLNLHNLTTLKRVYYKQIKYNDESIWAFDKKTNSSAYEQRLSTFLTEVQKDKIKHLELLNLYLIRERRKRLIVIIDNADQFSDEIQEKIFLYSQSLSRSSNCGVIICLREGYYYKWRNKPPFDAYESNVYHITAPKYSEVLLRRIDYTLKHLHDLEGTSKAPLQVGFVQIPNQSVIEFLSGLKDSLFSDYNRELIDYLSFTTYPNIREGLMVFKQFLTSGHTDVHTYIMRERFKDERRLNKQIIPIHEFVKSLGLHSKLYYNSDYSIIKNLFIPPQDSSDHFLNIYILKYFHEIFEKNGSVNKYISISECIKCFIDLGYRPNLINDSIKRLISYNMLESDDNISDIESITLESGINLAISSKGFYYFVDLITTFTYQDLCLQDTPIYEVEHFEKIKTCFPLSDNNGRRDLGGRVNTVRAFIDYLKVQEKKQPQGAMTRFGSIVQYIESCLSAHINKIEDFLKKRSG